MTKGNPKDVMTEEQIALTIWRIRLQMIALYLQDYHLSTTREEKEKCKQMTLQALIRLNEQGQKIQNISLLLGMPAATAELNALNAKAANSFYRLSGELTSLFIHA